MSRKQFWILVKCCICTGMSTGLVSNCIGIFYTPLAKSLDTGRGQIALIATIISVSTALGGLVIPKLIKRFPINWVMTAGAVLSSLGMLLLSFAKKLPLLYLIAVVIGFGAICYKILTVSIVLKSWFGSKSASKLGIAMATTGAVAAIMNPILARIIEGGSYEAGFRLLALLIAVLGIPAAFTISLGNEDASAPVKTPEDGAAKEKTFIPALLMGLMFLMPLLAAGATGMNTHISSYAVTLGYSLSFGATLVAFQSVFNSVWKLGYGLLADRVGAIRSGLIYLAGVLAATMVLIFLTKLPIAIIIAVCVFPMTYSISTVFLSVVVQEIARERYAEIYAIVNMIHTLAYALFTSLFGTISDKAGSYMPCLWIAVFCLILTGASCLMIAEKAKNGRPKHG